MNCRRQPVGQIAPPRNSNVAFSNRQCEPAGCNDVECENVPVTAAASAGAAPMTGPVRPAARSRPGAVRLAAARNKVRPMHEALPPAAMAAQFASAAVDNRSAPAALGARPDAAAIVLSASAADLALMA